MRSVGTVGLPGEKAESTIVHGDQLPVLRTAGDVRRGCRRGPRCRRGDDHWYERRIKQVAILRSRDAETDQPPVAIRTGPLMEEHGLIGRGRGRDLVRCAE